jgi:hypothetical protein
VGPVLCSYFLHAAGVGEIVVAVGKFDASLQEIGGVVIWVIETGGDPEAEEVRGVELAEIEGIDVGADALSECAGQFTRSADRIDFGEMRLESREAVGLNSCLVHVGLVKVGDFALVGAIGCVGFGGVFDNAGDLFVAEIAECVEDAEGRAIRGKFCLGHVGAVSVEVEVVAGTDGGIHGGDGDAGVWSLGWGLGCGG